MGVPTWLTAIATLVIAVATVIYATVTVKLLRTGRCVKSEKLPSADW
jgi:hypothetical protein